MKSLKLEKKQLRVFLEIINYSVSGFRDLPEQTRVAHIQNYTYNFSSKRFLFHTFTKVRRAQQERIPWG